MKARKIAQEEIATRFYCMETVFELHSKLKKRAFHFLADAGRFRSSDINQQHKAFLAIPILTTLIWQNTAHQPKAIRLIREFQ